VFDVALVVAGLAVLGWSLLAGAGGGAAVVVGVCLLLLGVALPARAALRAGRSRRVARREREAVGSGLALDVADPSLNTLVASYEGLRTAAGLPGVAVGTEAVEAGHAALLEVASLLAGRTPTTDEERAYVDRRTAAIRDLTAQLSRRYRDWQRSRPAAEPMADKTAAVVRARDELEAATGTGAVTELERLRVGLGGKDRHDGS
jgi:protein-S-isoprenylcysteine O-methyltransferase Ste14